jgi:hypothetical protein
MTVAALDVVSPYPQETYSSEGPTNGPGGTAGGGFSKPDISGFANVSTESYGAGSFNGTSSATPHVAGAAALLLSAFPSYTPAQLQTYLESHAIDMGAGGEDPVFGNGRLYLGTPAVSGPVVTNISPDTGLNNTIVHATITGSSFVNGATVKLTRSGQIDILATSVNVASATTITGDLDLTGADLGSWSVVVTNPDTSFDELTDGFTVTENLSYLFLPMLLKNFPVTPGTPVLNAIENADGNGAYTVSWSFSDYADSYTLEEDDNNSFTSPTEIYSGAALDKAVSGRGLGIYYYRVKAFNTYRESDWSNTQLVEVSVVPQPGDWAFDIIPGTTTQGEYSSIALDQNGYPNISFMNGTNIQFARWNGGAWESQTTDTLEVYSFPNTSLALNSVDEPLIAYPYNNPCYLGMSEWGGSAWNHTYINLLQCANYAEIALKADDEPCISYFVSRMNAYFSYDYNIELLCRTAGNWALTPTIITTNANYVVTQFEKARFHSMVLDSQNRPHISFTRGIDAHNLRYNGPNEDASSSVVVDSSPGVGFYSSLALDSQEYPRISYYDLNNGDLKYARWNGSTWLLETVDSIGDVGRFTSLALDASGYPHISYYDLTNHDLKYAYWDGSQWNIETVDSSGDVGNTTSLTLDGSGYPHISYYDVTSGRLKYATTSGILLP